MTGKILIVDDVPGQRLAVEAALAELGEPIVAVGSGAEALRLLLDDDDVAVILLDVNMPDIDGFETAALIRRRPRSQHTPIIFLTANADEIAAARAYSLGAVDYIVNPFPPEVLRAKVRVFVELAKMRERLKREADHRIALSREQAARAAAEQDSRRLRVLAEASGILSRSLDTDTLVADLLGLCVPRMADLAAIRLVGADGGAPATSWMDVQAVGRIRQGTAADDPRLEAALARVVERGASEPLAPDVGGPTIGLVLPLIARGRTFGAVAWVFRGTAADRGDTDAALLQDIAARAAIALDNSRLYHAIHERDRQKDEFLAMLSHELRNPLGAITTAVRLLDKLHGADEDPVLRARDVIRRQSAHLARLVDDLLDVGRLMAGQIMLERASVSLSQVVERVVETLRVAGRLDYHDLTVRLAPVVVNADGARIEQVITNLLVNAVKYTDRGGRIDVELSAEDAEAVVRVRDTGIGISAEMLPKLFEIFTQGGQTLDRAQGGLGVGLALVRRLVELHGGRAEAASDGPGQGSTFTVRLPRVTSSAAVSAPSPAPPDGGRCRLRVLVVEDNADARSMLRAVLEIDGHEVHDAADGLEALQVAGRVRPQVALIDLGLPRLDGLEVAARLRAADSAGPIFLVAVTGYGQEADRRRALEAGFDVHLTKPVDTERLSEILALAARHVAEQTVSDARGG